MPGHYRCSVKNCGNTYTSVVFDGPLSLHRFPKNNAAVRKAWIDFCGKPEDWTPTDASRICSEHFESNCFETNLQNQLCNTNSKRRLIINAIPTKSVTSSHEYNRKNSPEFVQSLSVPIFASEQGSTLTSECRPAYNVGNSQFSHKSAREIELEEEIIRLNKRCEDQQKKWEQLKLCNNNLASQLSKDKRKIAHLEKIFEEYKSEHSNCIVQGHMNQKIKEFLSGIFSSQQLDLALKIKKKVRWQLDDICKAITLRYFSKRAYLFLQKENYPLPSLRTIQLYCGKINLNTGILFDVLKFMNIGVNSMQEKEKAIVLLYDEMKVSSVYEYEEQRDEIVGPHNYVQIVMARSLFGNWKQPVYVDFDKNMNRNLLMELITELFRAEFEVVAVVGDLGSYNQGTLTDLEVHMDKQYFLHPDTNGKIFCFPDAPHLLMLVRNWILKTGFQLSNGVCISKEILVDMVRKAERKEVSSLFKITERHVTCTDNADKQNVTLACELLSHTIAVAIRRYYYSSKSENLADFIQLVNDWFDIMNSRDLKEAIELKKPYEGNARQNEILEKMHEMIETSRCVGKMSLQNFQKSILVSIKSLRGLFDEMKEKYKISFIQTYKLNQDALESLFGVLRTRGGLDILPTPIDLINRLRMVLLGKSPGIVHSHTNILAHDEGEVTLTSNVLELAGMASSMPAPTVGIDMEIDHLTNSPSSSACKSSENENIEKDGVTYLSGWLARKFTKTHPELGMYTFMLKYEDHAYYKPSWITELSHGGLTGPSPKLKGAIEYLETKFKKINKSTFSSKKNILEKLVRVLKAKVNIPEEVTRAFLKERIFIRMKKLNLKKNNEIKIRENRRPLSPLFHPKSYP